VTDVSDTGIIRLDTASQLALERQTTAFQVIRPQLHEHMTTDISYYLPELRK
jgi:hypothetical protein